MQITYCKGWSRFQRCMYQVWTEQKALKAHEQGDLYTVIVGSLEKPYCFIELNLKLKFVGVVFLDERLRDYLDYSFSGRKSECLFLTQVIYREYNMDELNKAIITKFNPNGEVKIRETNMITGEIKEKNIFADVSTNWEKIPHFGEYENISRFERR